MPARPLFAACMPLRHRGLLDLKYHRRGLAEDQRAEAKLVPAPMACQDLSPQGVRKQLGLPKQCVRVCPLFLTASQRC